MIQHLIDLMVEGRKDSALQSRRLVTGWRAPILALLAALFLNAILLFAIGDRVTSNALAHLLLGEGGTAVAIAAPPASNEVNHDGSTIQYGVVLTRPDGIVGLWVISDTENGAAKTYTATATTEVDDGIAVSDCVGVEVAEITPAIADKISKQDSGKCGGGGGDGGGGDEEDETIVHFGIINSRPHEKVGTWIISDTAYTVTDETLVSGEVSVGHCVEVRTRTSAPSVAYKIVGRDASVCTGDDGGGDNGGGSGSGGDDGGGEGESIELYGFVDSRPIEKVGTWVISDTAYTATENTLVFGEVVDGNCVQVKTRSSAPLVAVKIIKFDDWKCGRGGDDENNDYRREWEGIIVSYPLTLLGQWTITVGENKQLTFTTDFATRLNPALPTDYSVGRWVEVKIVRKGDGTLRAESVRTDEHELGEIVVRLASPAYSYTLASKYKLVLQSTLLTNANIYLYITNNEHEQMLAAQIGHEEGVIWAEVNYVNSVPEDDGYKTWGWGGKSEPDEYTDQSAYQQIRLGQASRAYTGQGVVVAILDTGIYTSHEQFVGKLRLPSLDVIDDDDDPSEVGPGLSWGHGTHVAGIISAIAPQATILPVRVLDGNGRGNTFLLAYAIEWATKQPGVKVINLSLGTEFDSRILRDAIENALQQGIIVVAAAGNGDTSQVQYPAGYNNVIGVTAVDSTSHKATFANYGSGWVDVSAPGVGIMSTMINAEGPGYASWSGTSMATAFVSGAAALVAEKWDTNVQSANLLLDQLTNTGLVVDTYNPDFAGQIGRQLDVSAALGVEASLLFVPATNK